jgi:hypothetical protein
MVSLVSLWLPILLGAVFVFVMSSIIHMFLGYHAGDWRPLPKEDEVMAALRGFDIPPGDYLMPRAGSAAAMKDPAFKAKVAAGPVAIMTIRPKGEMSMAGPMVQWFLYSIVINLIAAHITVHALGAGAHYRTVFRFIGETTFLGYALALPQFSIWYWRNWRTTLLSMFDALIYAALTAGTFGWLWPR